METNLSQTHKGFALLSSAFCFVPQILLFNLPVNFAQGTSIFWAYVVGFHESPLTAIQVLYVNLVTVRLVVHAASCQCRFLLTEPQMLFGASSSL